MGERGGAVLPGIPYKYSGMDFAAIRSNHDNKRKTE
jgi:hypothetical protein